jgi:hypothetical protein
MRKTSTIIGLAIATILTASALTMSNQAFADSLPVVGNLPVVGGLPSGLPLSSLPISSALTQEPGQDHVPHVGQVLGAINTTIDHILYSNPGMMGYSGLLHNRH